ncbi:MAG: iron-containing alcohol dehydrogenase, partial [Myxococcota bacterium]|nr:iron-containing alcohol dehydrogenase [Myxococcota bacterium]
MLAPDHILHRLTAPAARDGDPHRTRSITLGPGASSALPAWLQQDHPGQIDCVIADDHTWEAAGQAVHDTLAAGGRAPRRLILEPRHGDDHLVCEDGAITALETFLRTSERLNPIAVGAGTVNDIVKSAAFAVGRGYQVIPTAASMNGYTSSISAVLSGGVKRTLPTHQPEAVFADVDLIRAAPPVMNQAGFGDLLSKPFSQADWLLSHVVRGVDYSDEAATLLDGPWHQMVDQGSGIGTGDAAAIEVLLETLLISGFSMAIAGTSAPASGAEHLISHYWDMEQHCQDEPVRALHGTQVGIGTLVSAYTLARLVSLDRDAFAALAARAERPDAGWIDAVAPDHPRLTADVIAEIQTQLREKQRHGDAHRAELASLVER